MGKSEMARECCASKYWLGIHQTAYIRLRDRTTGKGALSVRAVCASERWPGSNRQLAVVTAGSLVRAVAGSCRTMIAV